MPAWVPIVCQNASGNPYPEELLAKAKHSDGCNLFKYRRLLSLTIKYSDNKRCLQKMCPKTHVYTWKTLQQRLYTVVVKC